MSRTFEELASQELDALYQGALFLSGGRPEGAERLLVDAVTLAFSEHTHDIADVERWLEARLVRSFVRHATEAPEPLPADTARRLALDPDAFDSIGSQELFEAAGELPAWPRAALWLVMLRRWSYEDAATALGVDPAVIPILLSYRDVLLQSIIASKPGLGARKRMGS
jgi:DNA-directed RNA polymerase specialized sigma24 family protein